MSGTAVYGILRNLSYVEGLVDSLRQQGFRSTDISLLLCPGSERIDYEKNPVASEGATPCSATVLRGSAFTWAVGVTALAFPGVGPLIAVGLIMDSFALEGEADCVVGSLARTLAGIGIAEYHAKRYECRLRSGGLLFSVHCRHHAGAQRAKELLEQKGAEDISSSIYERRNKVRFSSHSRLRLAV